MRPVNIIKGEGAHAQVKKRIPQTLLQHLEYIIELAENSKLNDDFFRNAKRSINFVAKTMNLTSAQSIIFAIFMEKSDDNEIRISDLSQFLGCRNIKTVCMMSDIDELETRRLVRCSRSRNRIRYRVPLEVIHAVKQNVAYKPESTQNLTTNQLFKHIDCLLNEREEDELSYESLLNEIHSLIDGNSSLAFCRQIKEYEKICINESILLLLLFCHRFINLDDDFIGFHDFEYLYEEKWRLREIKSNLERGNHELILNNIIEYTNDNGFPDKEFYRISATAKEKLFVELNIKVHQADSKKGLILHNEITPKQMFYNEREQAQIEQLTSLLDRENFVSVQDKLVKNGMRKGFACLFYGAPGTGKTETVYQIARSTGRDLMQVDIAETKSMWFGESEKRIKDVFDKYRAFVKTCDIAPVLLFNEADAVIAKRKDVTTGSVTQTENAIQNIILQEMEHLEGIMIATTNLTQNLDKAFERRFLYKIEFGKPNLEAKEKIWQMMLPALSAEERMELAKKYDYSGGQIENIVRKYTVDCILNGTEPSIATIHNYCRSEFLNKDDRKKIGF